MPVESGRPGKNRKKRNETFKSEAADADPSKGDVIVILDSTVRVVRADTATDPGVSAPGGGVATGWVRSVGLR